MLPSHSVPILVWNQGYELGSVPPFPIPILWKTGRLRLELLFCECLIELTQSDKEAV